MYFRSGVWSDKAVHVGWMTSSMYKPIGKYGSTEEWVKKNWERRKNRNVNNSGVGQ